MKTIPWLLPAFALVIGLSYAGVRWNVLTELKKDRDGLQHGLEAAKGKLAEVRSDDPGSQPAAKTDWREVAAAQKPGEEPRLPLTLRKRLIDMPDEELIAQMEEIAALPAGDEAAAALQSPVAQMLERRNPGLILERFATRLNQPRLAGSMPCAFRAWVARDATAAAQWLDRQAANGEALGSRSLDGRRSLRVQFETILEGALLDTDRGAAKTRLLALPESQRDEALTAIAEAAGPGSEAAVVRLIRAAATETQQRIILAGVAAAQGRAGYEAVEHFMSEGALSKTERDDFAKSAALARLADTFDSDRLEEARNWLLLQGPGLADPVTGAALAARAVSGAFDENAELACRYAVKSGSDETLASFLEALRSSADAEKGLAWLDRMNDSERREPIGTILRIRAGREGVLPSR